MNYVIAEQYLCFPALLEMVVKELTGKVISQYEIADWFGVVVPDDYNGAVNNIIRSNEEYDYGVHITRERINSFFTEKEIDLKVDYIEIGRINELFFCEQLKKKMRVGSIICSYSYGCLNMLNKALDLGHVSLILSVDDETIRIYDPGPDGYGEKNVNELLLYDAIRKRNGGLYIVSNN